MPEISIYNELDIDNDTFERIELVNGPPDDDEFIQKKRLIPNT